MDNLQYFKKTVTGESFIYPSFKPYYKWIIFNMKMRRIEKIIDRFSFKPYYKWIIFNIGRKSKNE